jgi:hypothetical protein
MRKVKTITKTLMSDLFDDRNLARQRGNFFVYNLIKGVAMLRRIEIKGGMKIMEGQ